jgi:tetratricopeptide (TPR) repeat protein
VGFVFAGVTVVQSEAMISSTATTLALIDLDPIRVETLLCECLVPYSYDVELRRYCKGEFLAKFSARHQQSGVNTANRGSNSNSGGVASTGSGGLLSSKSVSTRTIFNDVNSVSSAPSHISTATLMYTKPEMDRIRFLLQSYLATSPTLPPTLTYEVHTTIGALWEYEENYQAATDAYAKALRIAVGRRSLPALLTLPNVNNSSSPAHPSSNSSGTPPVSMSKVTSTGLPQQCVASTLHRLGRAYLRRQKFAEARHLLEQALEHYRVLKLPSRSSPLVLDAKRLLSSCLECFKKQAVMQQRDHRALQLERNDTASSASTLDTGVQVDAVDPASKARAERGSSKKRPPASAVIGDGPLGESFQRLSMILEDHQYNRSQTSHGWAAKTASGGLVEGEDDGSEDEASLVLCVTSDDPSSLDPENVPGYESLPAPLKPARIVTLSSVVAENVETEELTETTDDSFFPL